MRVYTHYAIDSLANSYVLGPDGPGAAVLIDPAVLDHEMLGLIEGNSYDVRAILVTHCDEQHLRGLHTILRVYTEATIYAAVPEVRGFPAERIDHGTTLEVCGMSIATIGLPGHSRDSFAFYVPGYLFTGCALTAGEIGYVPNPYAKAMLTANIRERLLTLPPETVVFPFEGPPTSIRIEQELQPALDEQAIAELP